MSVIYYPKSSVIYKRDTANGAYEQVELAVSPNTIIYFDTSSALQSVSSSIIYHTASSALWAQTASVILGSIESSSFSAYAISSSNAITAAFALSGGGTGTTLTTGSTYPITSSVAITASFAPLNPFASASLVTQLAGKEATITTGSTYPITASISISSSYSPIEPFASASLVSQLSGKQATLVTGNTYPITSSVAISASYAPYVDTNTWLTTGSLYPITSSNAVVSISSSFAPLNPFASSSLVSQLAGKQATITTGSTYPITSSVAISASYAPNNGSGTTLTTGSSYPITASWSVNVVNGSNGTTLTTGSTYPITSSWSISASWAPGNGSGTTLTTGSTYPITASWAVNVVNGSTGTIITTGSTYPITSSWAISASWAPGNGSGTTLTTGSNYPITTSWANQSISASYAPFEPFASSSIVTQLASKQATLIVGNTYTITSSWANLSISASYAPLDPFASASLVTQLASKQPLLSTGSTYPITSSWAESASLGIQSYSASYLSGSHTATVYTLVSTNPEAGGVQIQGGTNLPVYLHSNWPTLGFNAYYEGGWKYGAGSSNNFGAFQTFDVRNGFNGEMAYWLPTVVGNAGAAMTARQVFGMYADGRIRAPISFTEPSLVASDTDGYFYQIPITGSAYPITASWTNRSISASYSPLEPFASASLVTQLASKQPSLGTGSLYPITSSWAITSSYAPLESFSSASLVSQIGNKQNTITTGSLYQITSSVAISASYAPYIDTNTWLTTGSLYPITSSWAITSSYAPLEPFSSASFVSQLASKQATLVAGTLYNITASHATSASYAPYVDTNTWLTTGSLYPITSSVSLISISSSYSPLEPFASSSLVTQLGNKQPTLVTGTTYTITSSWAVSASYAPDTNTWLTTGSLYPITASNSVVSISSSFAPLNPFASASLVSQIGNKQDTLTTGGTYPITSSWSISASWAPGNGSGTTLTTGSTYPITASWALSASYALSSSTDQYIRFLPDGVTTKGKIGFSSSTSNDFVIEHQSSSIGGVSIDVTGSRAVYVATDGTIQLTGSLKFSQPLSSSFAISASWAPGDSGTALTTGSTYPITASWALSSSFAISASWAPGNGSGTTLTTGSSYPITSSWSISASWASVAFSSSTDQYINFLPDGVTTKGKIGFGTPGSNDFVIEHQSSSLGGIDITITGSRAIYVATDGTIQFTGSLKFSQPLTAATASYISTSFSRGGTLYNTDGISATANIIVWQATSNCTVTNVKGYRVGGTAATINARKNGTDNHLASAISIDSENTWIDGGAVQNASYTIGDKLEIMIVTVSGGPTQLAVQVNLKK